MEGGGAERAKMWRMEPNRSICLIIQELVTLYIFPHPNFHYVDSSRLSRFLTFPFSYFFPIFNILYSVSPTCQIFKVLELTQMYIRLKFSDFYFLTFVLSAFFLLLFAIFQILVLMNSYDILTL